jgi:alcohol dehydrogenase
VAELNVNRLLLVSDPGLAELGLVARFERTLSQEGLTVKTFCGLSTNPTTDSVHRALITLKADRLQAVIALGGGSPIDVAKAAAMLAANGGSYADYQWGGQAIAKPSLPLIAMPTTAGTGSEVSKVAVIVDTEHPFKKGVLSPHMFARAAILDPALTVELPPYLTAATGIDAFTHALEAYVGRQANPYTDMLAIEALRTIWHTLPRAIVHGDDLATRSKLLLASLWAGTAMDHAGLGLIHAISGPLTGKLHLHHGLANGLILSHVLRYNLADIEAERLQTLKALVGLPPDAADSSLVEVVSAFVLRVGLPVHLSDIDLALDETGREVVAEETTRMVMINNNPRTVSAAECRDILVRMA